MSIGVCGNPDCKLPYWRYRKDHPPSGYCSVPCHDHHRESKASHAAENPQVVLLRMMEHRRIKHNTDSVLTWFDCEECEILEGRYSQSLEWGYAAVTRDIALAARRRA